MSARWYRRGVDLVFAIHAPFAILAEPLGVGLAWAD